MKEKLFYQGGAKYFLGRELEDILVNILDVSLFNKLKLDFGKPKQQDLNFESNQDFWHHILSNKAYVDQVVILSNFYITEWLPMSPGLFFTKDAIHSRRLALGLDATPDGYVRSVKPISNSNKGRNNRMNNTNKRVAVELDPFGKSSMVQGGIGCLRLQPKRIFNEEQMYLFGASSNGICHEGIPIILPSSIYHNVINQIKDDCGLVCKITGRLLILPTDKLPIKYTRTVSKYCLLVEEITNEQRINPNDVLISVAITYSKNLREIRHKEWSFACFNPDSTDSQLLNSVEWLHNYSRKYSHVDNPIIMADFDEYKQHFEKIDFSLKDIANGNIDFVKLAQYEDFLNLKIINIMGDYFNNIRNSTIVNKSIVQKAFNKVKNSIDEDTAAALAQIAEHVEKSGNKEAGEVFNAFNEELQKPEPKKSILKSFWNGLSTLLPTVSTIAGIAEKVIKIIG